MPRHIEISGATGYESKSFGRFALPAKKKSGPKFKKLSMQKTKEVQIVYRLFLVNFYLLHVPRLPSQPASSGRG